MEISAHCDNSIGLVALCTVRTDYDERSEKKTFHCVCLSAYPLYFNCATANVTIFREDSRLIITHSHTHRNTYKLSCN